METILLQLFNLLVEPPGNLIYHLVLVFATLAALQAVSLLDQPENHQPAVRMRVGLLIILAAQVLLFGISVFGWQNLIDTRTVLPPLDRAVVAVTLLWLGWMILFPQKNKIADWTIAIFTLALAGFFAYSLINWSLIVGQGHFNNTSLDFTWATIFLAISVFCGILIVFFRPENWGTGLGMYIIIFLGSILHLSLPAENSDYPGALRLALICVFPLLPGLVQSLKKFHIPAPGIDKKRTRYRAADFRTAQAWSKLAGVTDVQEASMVWLKALGYSVDADVCLLISSLSAEGTVSVIHGWDLAHQQSIALQNFPLESLPSLDTAFRNGKSLTMSGEDSNGIKDYATLTRLFGIEEACEILAAPFSVTEAGWNGIIAMVSSMRKRWSQEDAQALATLAKDSGRYLQKLPKKHMSDRDIENLEKMLEQTKGDVQDLREERRLLLEELDLIRYQQDASTLKINMDSLMEVQREMQETITSLEAENDSLRKILLDNTMPEVSDETLYLEQEVRATLEETAHLQNALAEASITIMNLQQRGHQAGVLSDDSQRALIKTLQNMYGPISSIVADTNLLSNESIEMMDPIQQGFMGRIHQSSEQLKTLMDELVETFGQSASPIELAKQPVLLSSVIDQAVGDISPLLNAKNVNMRITFPEDLPPVYADRDGLQQIVSHLLQNAVAVTPNEGSIELEANADNVLDDSHYLVIKITDEGGGIPPDEIGKVFNKEYRVDHPTISGLSDSGTGLIITRALVEAHNGRIWVESGRAETSTFIVLLPLENLPMNDNQLQQ
ncbi:MAG: sensor histidine kinase [Bellilinea sp.]